MYDEVQKIKTKTDGEKEKLVWQTSGLIAFAALVSGVFISLIFKPVRQIDKSIESLGEGDFQTPVLISGPKDLESLGMKLD